MGHLSIAIIKKAIKSIQPKSYTDQSFGVSSENNRTEYEYLVIKNSKGNYQFYEKEEQVIGRGFDFSTFKDTVLSFLQIDKKDDGELSKFESEPSLFKISKSNPFATSYEYIVYSGETVPLIPEQTVPVKNAENGIQI